ncbi:MAG: hypothetical protein COU90_02585 [Candidatus Ryanbacteria bacterium CG10_big_fil_rev_8_21_14_0_10_43_42]|uniref:SET domain-containing protein n=1 Tax=Candidatus Ryanbacteria bacterium CG10_big_fil_rev_8_21_14_0_10_43_42 TaxID=1974864 RepID=A0A2M8KWK3_9BACT|nr:MAG: hypothetical protein COU90_02585 [Candidatus Ryanbacteria bacterium CG10_big_fil_rev_8_21_14_0_10_43_42]
MSQKYTTHKDWFCVKRAKPGAGLALFTKREFKKGDFVIEYTGEKISDAEADRRGGKYLFTINTKWTLDAKDHKHLARYINHACKPNCETDERGGRILIFATRTIKPGEEITYDYGEEYFDDFIKPHGCKCPAKKHGGHKNRD